MRRILHHLVSALCCLSVSLPVQAEQIRIAVASNFAAAIKHLARDFEQETGHRVILAFGSTGKHYAQITSGAPFEAFFAADSTRPKLLEQQGLAQPGTRFTYALGKLALWSPNPSTVDQEGKVLIAGDFRFLALANPKLAPYGKAAQQVIQAMGVQGALQGRVVRGENIAQTFQFVGSGNADLGFVAWSQIKQPGAAVVGSFWLPPESLYDPIEQQALLLRDSAVARKFLDFVQDETARKIINDYGYTTP